jgi:hypothetical protein
MYRNSEWQSAHVRPFYHPSSGTEQDKKKTVKEGESQLNDEVEINRWQ